MAGWRRAVELAMTNEEIERLTALSRSRTEPASRVSRAQMLLAYRENPCSVRWGKASGSTIKRFSAAWSGRWAMGRWRPSRIDHGRAKEPVNHAGGQSLVGVAGMRQGQGARLSA